jgi:hypothetical protein
VKYFYISLLILISIFLPTIYGDTAFYLTQNAALRAINDPNKELIWTLSYQGLIELIISNFIKNKYFFINFYKSFVLFINFIIFRSIPYFRKNNIDELTILIIFLSLQLYLAPSEYSFVVGGMSLIILSSVQSKIILNIFFLLSGIFLLGLDLPNPKYIGLGLLLYLNTRYIYLKENCYKKIELYVILCFIFFIISVFIYIYIKSNIESPPNYNIRNNENELLDLAFNRNYLSAIIPFKENKIFFPIYLCTLIYFITNILFAIKNKQIPNYIIILTGLNFYFSLGILEPLGALERLAQSSKMFSFIRTRAGYDLYLYIYLLIISLTYPTIKISKIIRSTLVIVFILVLIKYFFIYHPNLNKTLKEAKLIEYLEELNIQNINGCYISKSQGYSINPIFGFGPHLIRLTTNYTTFTPETYVLNNEKNCQIIITDIDVNSEIIDINTYNYRNTFYSYEIYTRK